ncbi:MAG: hypothetical protein JZU64_11255 [Rhodoferax sp.]|nr:hypothetical protein [Rhodoferax sp.]
MAATSIHRLIVLFDQAFRGLSRAVPMTEVERMALLVNQSMAAATRVFHTDSHVFNLCRGLQPLQVLAALFHDVVYYQIDGGFPAPAAQLLEGVTRAHRDALLLESFAPDDLAVALCADVFGFSPGQVLLLSAGMNEFLSAVVAARLLQGHLDEPQLLAVVACIAATVPFRDQDAAGQTAADTLALRLRARCQQSATALAGSNAAVDAFVKTVITDAVTLANQDVAGFTDPDVRHCLSNTWLLLKESNPSLRQAAVFGLQEYRAALQRADTFLQQLNPALICQSYDSYPAAAVCRALTLAAARNIGFSRDYLAVELSLIAIIEALALTTGGDCPAALFLGESHAATNPPCQTDAALPLLPAAAAVNAELLALLDNEHLPGAINDLVRSPLKPWLYRLLGPAGIRQTLQQARRMFQGTCTAPAFLQLQDRTLMLAIIRACQHNAPSRHEALALLENRI